MKTVLQHPVNKMTVKLKETLTIQDPLGLHVLIICICKKKKKGSSFYLCIDTSNEPRRYGLGSEERRPTPNYGTNSSHQEEYSVPNHMVGLLIGKGGENLKKIERSSGVSKVQFAQGKKKKVFFCFSFFRERVLIMLFRYFWTRENCLSCWGIRPNQQSTRYDSTNGRRCKGK